MASEQDRKVIGNLQVDLVEHCGSSAQGQYLNTLTTTDINTGWWEGEAIMGRGEYASQQGLVQARARYPFAWVRLHSDNGAEFINWHLYRYTQKEKLDFSRSRPYKKNDNCLIEQKNWTHVKKFVGYLRYDTEEEQTLLNDLYCHELRLYKNFFQPVIKLKEKMRIEGKILRKYEPAMTPYARVMASDTVSPETKKELRRLYDSLNPAELKRVIDGKLDKLYAAYQKKMRSPEIQPHKQTKPSSVTFLTAQPEAVSVT